MRKMALIKFFILILILHLNAKNLKIVSLTPSVTKQLIVLGMKKDIVGCTSYGPLAKEKNATIHIVGGVSNTNIEGILRLKPDIVFANSLTPVRIVEKLKALRIKVIIFPYPKSIEEIFSSFLTLGKIVGRKKRAEEIIKVSENKLRKIEKISKKFTPKKIFFIIGSKPLYTAPEGTYINDLIEKINCINIARNLKNGIVSREFVIERNPDVILIMDMGEIAKEEISYWKKFKSLNAVKNKKIFIIDADRLGSPVLPDFINLIEEIMKLVHENKK